MAAKKKQGGKAASGGPGKSVVVVLLLFLSGCAAWLFLKPAQVMVPSVVGMTGSQAKELLQASGLGVATRVQQTDQAEQDGKVLIQSPAAATAVAKMSVVSLVIGKGPDGVSLPNLAGKTRSEAEDAILRLGLKVEFTETRSDTVPIGRVVSQQPAAGQKVAPHGTVTLTISGGVGDIVIPDLYNLTLEEARAALEKVGLSLEVAEVAKEDFREGDPAYILRQEPAAGQTLSAGAKVTVFLPIVAPVGGATSPNGGAATHAPRFEGLTVASAKKLAAEQGVELEFADAADDRSVITFQDPPTGDPLPGAKASVVVKVAPAAVVPNLSGLSETQARAELQKAGLSVGAVRKSFGDVAGEVLDQRPSAGIEAVSGSPVDLVISDPQAPASSAQAPSPTPAFTPDPWVE